MRAYLGRITVKRRLGSAEPSLLDGMWAAATVRIDQYQRRLCEPWAARNLRSAWHLNISYHPGRLASFKIIIIWPLALDTSSKMHCLIVWQLRICNFAPLSIIRSKHSSLTDEKSVIVYTPHPTTSLSNLACCLANVAGIMFTNALNSMNRFCLKLLWRYPWLFIWAYSIPVYNRRVNIAVYLIHFHLRKLFSYEDLWITPRRLSTSFLSFFSF